MNSGGTIDLGCSVEVAADRMDKLDAIGFYSESLPLDIDKHQENGLRVMVRTKKLLQTAPLQAPPKVTSPVTTTEASSFSSGFSESTLTTNPTQRRSSIRGNSSTDDEQQKQMKFSIKFKDWLLSRSPNEKDADHPCIIRRGQNLKHISQGKPKCAEKQDDLEQIMTKQEFFSNKQILFSGGQDSVRNKWITAGYSVGNRYYYYAAGGKQGVYHVDSDLWWYPSRQLAKEALWHVLASWTAEDDGLLELLKQNHGKRSADHLPDPSTERPRKRRASMSPSVQSITQSEEPTTVVAEGPPVFPLNIKPDWLLWTHTSRRLRDEDTAKPSSSGTNKSKPRCFQKCRRFETTGECPYGFKCIHAHVYKHGRFGVPEHVTKALDRSEIQVWCHQTENLSSDKSSSSPRLHRRHVQLIAIRVAT